MMRTTPILALSATLLGLSVGAARAGEPPLRIGVSEPLTGVNAFYGQQARLGTELALREANAAGGIGGRMIEADYQDNACNPADGVKSVTQMLSTSRYLAIVDGGCSSVALAIMPLIEQAKVPYVVANPSATAISERSGAGGNIWTFKVNPSDGTMLVSLVDWLVKEGQADHVAVLAEDTDYGRGGAKALNEALAAKSRHLGETNYFQKGTNDFSNALARLRAAKPSALAIFAIGADSTNLLSQYAESGGAPLTGRIQLEQIPAQIAASPAFKGLSTVQPWDMSVDLPANKRFIEAFRALANADPTVNAWDSYEATRVLLAAIQAAGADPTPAKVRDALETVRVPAMFGGTLDFDKNHLAHINAIVLTLKDGKPVVLGMSRT
jgi:branched-chain amino acid transport system substrate-binding protein